MSHAWLLDPIERTLERLRLEHGQWTIAGVHGGQDDRRAEPFDATSIALADLWAD